MCCHSNQLYSMLLVVFYYITYLYRCFLFLSPMIYLQHYCLPINLLLMIVHLRFYHHCHMLYLILHNNLIHVRFLQVHYLPCHLGINIHCTHFQFLKNLLCICLHYYLLQLPNKPMKLHLLNLYLYMILHYIHKMY